VAERCNSQELAFESTECCFYDTLTLDEMRVAYRAQIAERDERDAVGNDQEWVQVGPLLRGAAVHPRTWRCGGPPSWS
jgi:hypothetical protein